MEKQGGFVHIAEILILKVSKSSLIFIFIILERIVCNRCGAPLIASLYLHEAVQAKNDSFFPDFACTLNNENNTQKNIYAFHNNLENVNNFINKDFFLSQMISGIPRNYYRKKYSGFFPPRKGDWICCECSNLNFSFRYLCNRCGKKKIEVNREAQ